MRCRGRGASADDGTVGWSPEPAIRWSPTGRGAASLRRLRLIHLVDVLHLGLAGVDAGHRGAASASSRIAPKPHATPTPRTRPRPATRRRWRKRRAPAPASRLNARGVCAPRPTSRVLSAPARTSPRLPSSCLLSGKLARQLSPRTALAVKPSAGERPRELLRRPGSVGRDHLRGRDRWRCHAGAAQDARAACRRDRRNPELASGRNTCPSQLHPRRTLVEPPSTRSARFCAMLG